MFTNDYAKYAKWLRKNDLLFTNDYAKSVKWLGKVDLLFTNDHANDYVKMIFCLQMITLSL